VGLEYISSAGLRVVPATHKRLKGRGGTCRVLNLTGAVKEVFAIVNAFPALDIFASQAEADDYFDRLQKGEIGHRDCGRWGIDTACPPRPAGRLQVP
jgi:STAS domain